MIRPPIAEHGLFEVLLIDGFSSAQHDTQTGSVISEYKRPWNKYKPVQNMGEGQSGGS